MRRIVPVLVAALHPGLALGDEGGASVWLPGQFASFAAVPGDPGFSLETMVYVRSASAVAGTSFSRGGGLLAGLSVNEQYVYLTPTYTFETPVLNGQLALGVTFSAGQSGASVWGVLTGPGGRSLAAAASDSASGISDLYPMASLKWQQGDHNAMVYVMGSVPTAGRLERVSHAVGRRRPTQARQLIPMFRLIDRYLDPSESLLEILFGLIMALTMTAGARLLSDPATVAPIELMVALVGCNVAWGAIDAVFYLLGSLFNRNRRVRFVRRLQAAASDEQAIALIREEFTLEGEPPTRAEDRAVFHRSVLAMLRHASAERAHFRPEELAAAAIVLVLVSLTVLPGLIPLLLIDHVDTALRAANALQVVLLFIIGYRWSHYAGTPGWRGALIVGLLGVALVLVAVALGG